MAVDVGEPQLRAGVRPLLAGDDPHPGRPAGQVEQAGDVRDPRAVPDLPVTVIGGRPRTGGDFADGLLDVLGDGEAD